MQAISVTVEASLFCSIGLCDNRQCPAGHRCEIFEQSGEAYCGPSCDIDNGGCPAGQRCSVGAVRCLEVPQCVPLIQCTSKYTCMRTFQFVKTLILRVLCAQTLTCSEP